MFDRDADSEFVVTAEWDGGVEWLAHPNEPGQRASHALVGEDGVWVVDPLDAPGLDERLAELGEVAGVVVCSDYHARDAGTIARRHGVPVHVPVGLDRVASRFDDPITWFRGNLGDSGFEARTYSPLPGWSEAALVGGGTLYVPDLLGTAPTFTVGDERLGVFLFRRPAPIRAPFADLDPDRILVGHGTAVETNAPAALSDALGDARRRFPRALATNGPTLVRSFATEFREYL